MYLCKARNVNLETFPSICNAIILELSFSSTQMCQHKKKKKKFSYSPTQIKRDMEESAYCEPETNTER